MKKLTVLLLLLLFSCKSIQYEPTIITLSFKCLNDEIIRLFYIDYVETGFSTEMMLTKRIQGKDEFQHIVFEIPAKHRPKSFRIDLGENKVETAVFIEDIKISYGDKELYISKGIIKRYFKENIYVETLDYHKFFRKSVENRYDPFLKSSPLLEKYMYLEFR